jgi:type I restriction enzyme S subunit
MSAIPAGYKQTDVGVIPLGWSVKRIGELATVGSGGTPSRENAAYWNGDIPWITTSQINFNTITEADQFISVVGLKNSAAKLLPAGTLLMALYGQGKTRGKVGVLGFEAATNQACASISPTGDISPEFLLHYLASRYEAIRNSSNTGSQENLNGQIVKDTPVVFPPILEQRAIAAALSDVDALLAKLDQFIAKKRDLKQAAMQQLLTGQTRLPGFGNAWEVKRLGEVAEIVMGQSPSSSNYNTKGLGLPLTQGNADIVNRKTIRRIFTTEITKRGKCGDILMSVRAPVGEISRAVFDVCLGRGVCAIRYPNDFLYHFLVSQEPSWARLSKGSTFDSVNSADVKALEVGLPKDEAEQTAIASVLSDMDAELVTLEARRDKTRALKQAMMQELLTGRTRLL